MGAYQCAHDFSGAHDFVVDRICMAWPAVSIKCFHACPNPPNPPRLSHLMTCVAQHIDPVDELVTMITREDDGSADRNVISADHCVRGGGMLRLELVLGGQVDASGSSPVGEAEITRSAKYRPNERCDALAEGRYVISFRWCLSVASFRWCLSVISFRWCPSGRQVLPSVERKKMEVIEFMKIRNE